MRSVGRSRRNGPRSAAAVAWTTAGNGGCFLAWALAGAVVYPAGAALAAAEMRAPGLARALPAATGVVILLAGAVQHSAWKARRLDACRNSPACCGPVSPCPLGALRAGRQCAVCCAAPMAVLLAACVMDLAVMAAVTAAITLERTTPRPRRSARASGVVIVGARVAVIVRANGVFRPAVSAAARPSRARGRRSRRARRAG